MTGDGLVELTTRLRAANTAGDLDVDGLLREAADTIEAQAWRLTGLSAEVVRLQAEVDRQLKDALDWRHRYGREVIAREALEAENARLRARVWSEIADGTQEARSGDSGASGGNQDRILWNREPGPPGGGSSIDELVVHDCHVHVEQMSDTCWWIGIDKGEARWSGNFTAARGMEFSEQENDGLEWGTERTHDSAGLSDETEQP